MHPRKRTGFTLVEMLVVVVIISMLAALLLPAVQSARERARQTQCQNNQKELAVAVQQYETKRGHLPGWLNRYGTVPVDPADTSLGYLPMSWTMMILPYMGRNDLWQVWSKSNVSLVDKLTTMSTDGGYTDLPQLKCPSDQEPTVAFATSYVANCGMPDSLNLIDSSSKVVEDTARTGVFQNHMFKFDSSGTPVPLLTNQRVQVKTSSLPDGAQNTLMITENVQAFQWTVPLDLPPKVATPALCDKPKLYEQSSGVTWWPDNVTPAPTRRLKINEDAKDILDIHDSSLSDEEAFAYARPSSNHPNLLIVTYCDGHQDVLSTDGLDHTFYKLLLCPADSAAQKRTPPLIVP